MERGLHPLSKPVAALTRKIRTVRDDPHPSPGVLEALVEQMVALFSQLTPDAKNIVEVEVNALLQRPESQ